MHYSTIFMVLWGIVRDSHYNQILSSVETSKLKLLIEIKLVVLGFIDGALGSVVNNTGHMCVYLKCL